MFTDTGNEKQNRECVKGCTAHTMHTCWQIKAHIATKGYGSAG